MKLQNSTLNIVQITTDFICKLVFKDEVKALENETQESALNGSIYLGAYLKNDDNTDEQRLNIIANYTELNPYYNELRTKHGIEPHISRLGKDLDIIYQDEDDILANTYLVFYRTLYKECLTSFYVTSYSQALVYKDNYRNFCLLCINLMTFLNLMSKWLENPFDIDIMDEKQVERFMASFGIPYFNNLPIKYKRLLAKNLNTLIRSKGTDKVIIDILDIFDFTDISIFKHYLVKSATTEEIDDISSNRDYLTTTLPKKLQFLSHNIRLPSLNYAVRTNAYRKTLYELMISSDPHWQATASEIQQVNFDYVRSKYFSIETGFEISKETMNTVFMLNLIKKIRTDFRVREALGIHAKTISPNTINLEDAIITLQILTCDYNGVVDNIPYDLATINGVYEFATFDNATLNLELVGAGSTLNSIELADMRTVQSFTTAEVLKIHSKNSAVYDNITNQMAKETSYARFKKLRSAHNAKFIQKLNYDLFGGVETYTDYIEAKSTDLYTMISDLRAIVEDERRQIAIAEAITILTDVISSALDNFKLMTGTTNIDILVNYLKQVILTFKSFTVTLRDLDVFIIMREKHQTRILDNLTMQGDFELSTRFVQPEDALKITSKPIFEDNYRILDRVNIKVV